MTQLHGTPLRITESETYTIRSRTELMTHDRFGDDRYIRECPNCMGEGRCGDLPGGTTSEREARHFGGSNFRVCEICGGTGHTVQDITGTRVWRIAYD